MINNAAEIRKTSTQTIWREGVGWRYDWYRWEDNIKTDFRKVCHEYKRD